MIKNLLRVALRNFIKDKWYSLLNILGLTIGITFSLFLVFYVKDELNYDRYHKNADNLYRINSYIKEPEKEEMKLCITQFVLGQTLGKDFPEVQEAVRFVNAGKPMFKNGDLRFYNEKVYFADSNVFRAFTYQFIEGDAKTALMTPNSMVLTQSVAEKYFGLNKQVVGKTLQNDKGDLYKITGVVRDVPKNSHLIFNILLSSTTLPKDYGGGWGGFNIFTYVLLKPNTDAAVFEKKLLPLYQKYMAPIFAQFNIKIHYGVMPITAIHLHSDMQMEPEELGSMSYIYIFSAVALFMLLIACINYMNLATARSARRAKEIGIRKVTGSTKSQLVTQFLMESVMMAVFSLVLSMGLVAALLPVFNTLSGKHIPFSELMQPGTFVILLCIVLFVGLVGGSYPAFYLSKFNPITVLKGSLAKGSSNVNLRRILVVTQFSISMVMIICTWIVYGQLKYLREKDLGFNKEQVVSLQANANNDVSTKIRSFIDVMRRNPNVLSISTSQSVPGSGNINFNLFSIETNKGYVEKGVYTYAINENYVKTLGMKIVKGRDFAGPGDTLRSLLVNENMVKYYGWGDNPIGKKIKFVGDTSGRYFEVVGVIKDFNQQSLYNPIAPLVLFYTPVSNGIQLKITPQNIPGAIASMESAWKNAFPELPFSYTFLDQDFDGQYAADQKRGKIFTAFSILTIAITCLGLLGLIAFTTQQRQKEISIRKVMGASLTQLVPLITRNFIFLVGISCIIAFPVAYLFMDNWLKKFQYSTGLSVLPFLLSAVAVLVITLLTTIFHTLKAALANPSKSLRSE